MTHFSIKELTDSTTATAKGIDNTPTEEAKTALVKLVGYVLDPIRERYGRPINVNSGYRCEALNRAIGGAKNSQHTKGEAADITVGTPEQNRVLFDLIRTSGIPFDQLIDERGYKWIHISYADGKNRKQILHL